jgi:hypothetical protein
MVDSSQHRRTTPLVGCIAKFILLVTNYYGNRSAEFVKNLLRPRPAIGQARVSPTSTYGHFAPRRRRAAIADAMPAALIPFAPAKGRQSAHHHSPAPMPLGFRPVEAKTLPCELRVGYAHAAVRFCHPRKRKSDTQRSRRMVGIARAQRMSFVIPRHC